MSERKRKLFVYAICGIALIWVALNYSSKQTAPAAENSLQSEQLPPATTAAVAAAPVPLPQAADSSWGRDPFARGFGAEDTEAEPEYRPARPQLSAISGANGSYLAVIDGRVVGVGEEVHGWKVVAITAQQAHLELNGEQLSLTLKGD